MPNYVIKIVSPGSAIKGPRSTNYSTWKCPFCQGTGLSTFGKSGSERCPACRGMKAFEADIVSTLLATCGRCAGNGRINYMGDWAVCPNCKGSGKI